MSASDSSTVTTMRPLRRVLILADESAHWRIAGLPQLHRLLLTLQEFNDGEVEPGLLEVCVWWNENGPRGDRSLPLDPRLERLELVDSAEEFLGEQQPVDLVLSTRVFAFRKSIAQLREALSTLPEGATTPTWETLVSEVERRLGATQRADAPWRYISSRGEIAAAERAFLRENGKTQDGFVSRYLNRRVSRFISRGLMKLPITPSAWSVLIFILPLIATWQFLRGSYAGFVVGAAIFQLYSILDGCDGEIARAKFLQTDFGRRLDSFLDLVGNILLALGIGFGLARFTSANRGDDWFYISEGIVTAILIATSEGIVFARRSRGEASPLLSARWNGALYQRHHEFFGRSGILFLGEGVAWWLVQLTKRDMAMVGFLLLALAGWPAGILHLQLMVAGVASALAGNAFLRQPAAALAPEAS
jgi:phosphatidylglycerophosphate synthase